MFDVVVIGGANLDIKAKTLAPHVAATSNPAAISSKPGGVGRNIAHNLARLGCSVALVSVVGDDAAGAQLLATTQVAGVDVSSVQHVAGTTGTYLAILDDQGELVTAVSDMRCLETMTAASLDWAVVAASRYVVADCNVPIDVLHTLAERAGGKLIVEPVSVAKSTKLARVFRQRQVFCATPNIDQLQVLAGTREPELGAKKLHEMGISNVVIHAGANGAYAFDGVHFYHTPAVSHHIVDVTGAGDAATAGLVAGLLEGKSLQAAVAQGQDIAARVIGTTSSTVE